MKIPKFRLIATIFVAALCCQAQPETDREWRIEIPEELKAHAAVDIAANDLRTALESIGEQFSADEAQGGDLISVLVAEELGADDSYAWETIPAGTPVVALSASTPLGAAYALERLAWLARSDRAFPPPSRQESPALAHRFLRVSLSVPQTREGPSAEPNHVQKVTAQFRDSLRQALRFGFNYVVVSGMENYIPWDDPHYGPRSERYRVYLRAAVEAAHEHGLKLLLYGDEALYLPSWLEKFEASPSVADPKFWEALQEKYRLLLGAVPGLDGVGTRIGEMIPKFDFRALDLIHSPVEGQSLALDDRYRTFIQRMHEVVSGEFGKLFYHRNWVVNDWEQHSVPVIYQDIYSAVPAQNLFVSIKLTKQDQWYYGSAFNPTFGQTRHTTVAEGEIYSNYHGFGTLLDFPARWFGAAMEFAWRRENQGVFTGYVRRNIVSEGMLYVFSRLAWDPIADVKPLTREWAATAFGREVSEPVTEILMMSAEASRYGFYLPPVSLVGWNPLRHIRVNKFVVEGDPLWDQGRGHDEFLRELYLMCEPYYDETYSEVGRGYEIASQMFAEFNQVQNRIESASARNQLRDLLDHGLAVMALTRDYTRAFLSYFSYRDDPSTQRMIQLSSDVAGLRRSVGRYRARYKHYDLAGIDQFIVLAERMLEDRREAESILSEAPSEEEIEQQFTKARLENERLLQAHPDAERILTWKGTVDGRDILRIHGDQVRIEHLAADPIRNPKASFERPLPEEGNGQWAIRPVQARGVVYLLEKPSPGNNHTLSVYLEDPESGSAVFEFELYRIP